MSTAHQDTRPGFFINPFRMAVNSETNLGESSRSSTLEFIYNSLAVTNSSILAATCSMCQRSIPSDNEIESLNLCGDCKFLLLEDLQASSPDIYTRRTAISRRIRYGSSESIESMFSQQFSQIINITRQTRDYQSNDVDSAARSVHPNSSRTTPRGATRWRRVFSDTESDGFNSVETESNVSFRRYMSYGGDSDASVDGQSVIEYDNFALPDRGESDVDSSDTDIDPMNAGIYQWNSEDQEEEEEEEDDDDDDDDEWEEVDIEGNTVESSNNENDNYINWRRQILLPEDDGTFMFRIQERIQEHTADLLTNFEESDAQIYVGDYLDARGFDNLLDHLAETENSRRGAPPTSESFVKNIPHVRINEDHEKLESLACAICKEAIIVGTVVNQLPCFHFYHTNCILPWLSTRNTCPLCRYELPTDDKEYEERKRRSRNGFDIHELNVNEDSSFVAMNEVAVNERSRVDYSGDEREVVNGEFEKENGRNRWFFLAAPIVSVVGISLMLWFGKPPVNRITCRRENSHRRWWSFF